MKIEISIEAGNLVKQDLLPSLKALVPAQQFPETFPGHSRDRFRLKFIHESGLPDRFLQGIEAIAAKIEKQYPEEEYLDVHVRNVECSEVPLCSMKKGSFISPAGNIHIVPWSERQSPVPESPDIYLHPAGAFGSGLHPSTSLCLRLLKLVAELDTQNRRLPRSVLDIGCGSGILSIAALRLGAKRVLAVEIDPGAVNAARRNIQINQLAHSAHVLEKSWQDVRGQYDMVVANLVPSVLYKAAPNVAEFLAAEGLLITAGFPASVHKKVLQLFEKKGLRLQHETSRDGWGALLLAK